MFGKKAFAYELQSLRFTVATCCNTLTYAPYWEEPGISNRRMTIDDKRWAGRNAEAEAEATDRPPPLMLMQR